MGPLVVAGVLIDESRVDELRPMGVRDSKLLSPRRREVLAEAIRDMARGYSFFELQPRAIDLVVERGERLRKLNYLEAMAMAKVIRDLGPDAVYIDPSDVLPDRFAEQILRVLRYRPIVVCEHHADETYQVVSAASILAKVRRDGVIAELRMLHGDFGSGYCHDERTISFLEAWFRKSERPPPFVRSSWETVKRIQRERVN